MLDHRASEQRHLLPHGVKLSPLVECGSLRVLFARLPINLDCGEGVLRLAPLMGVEKLTRYIKLPARDLALLPIGFDPQAPPHALYAVGVLDLSGVLVNLAALLLDQPDPVSRPVRASIPRHFRQCHAGVVPLPLAGRNLLASLLRQCLPHYAAPLCVILMHAA